MAAKKKLTFEQRMQRLEEIVRQLEQGEVPLEVSMQLFEEGTKLSKELHAVLENAEQKIATVEHDEAGKPVLHEVELEEN